VKLKAQFLVAIRLHPGAVAILFYRHLQEARKIPVMGDPVFPVLSHGRRLGMTFDIAVDDIDGHAESGSSPQLKIFRIRLPFSGHNRMTGRFAIICPHPEPQRRSESGYTVMAHQLRMRQQR
jgi:hypothetical protein